MKCILLCAGYATRLYPLTREKPKSLLPVGNVPMIERILDKIIHMDEMNKVYVVTNHRFIQHFYYWHRDYEHREKVEIFDDNTMDNDDRLGAIGDIEYVVKNAKINEDMIVVAGDNLLMFDITDFLKFGKKHRLAIAVKDVKNKKLASLYGAVKLGSDNQVLDFEEKPPSPKSTLISICLYYIAKEHVPLVSKYLAEGHNKDAPGYYIGWLFQNYPLYAWTIKGQWLDIGDIDSYNKANALFGVS